jgi:hypothetical protein
MKRDIDLEEWIQTILDEMMRTNVFIRTEDLLEESRSEERRRELVEAFSRLPSFPKEKSSSAV